MKNQILSRYAVFSIIGLCAFALFFSASCSRNQTGELSGVVQLSKLTNSEGVLVFIPGTEYRALTDSNGAFLITNIPPGEYVMTAQSDGYTEIREDVIITAGSRASIGPFILTKPHQPEGTLSGFVTLEGERTHEDVLLILVGDKYTTTSNTTGYYQITGIEPGEYLLLALKENWLPVYKSDIKINDGLETQVEKFELKKPILGPTPTPAPPTLGDKILQGMVFLEDETDHTGISVVLEDTPGIFAITDASGAFRITGLDEEKHNLVLSHNGFLDEVISNAIPVAADSTQSCGFVTLQKEYRPEGVGVLQGHVYLDDQLQHGNTTVQLEGIFPSVWTDAEGRYKIVGVPAGVYRLIAGHPGYATGTLSDIIIRGNYVEQAPELTLNPSEDNNSDAKGEIVGLALLEGKDDQGGILVAIEGTSLISVTGPEGNFAFPEVPVGAYTLIYTKGEYKTQYLVGVPVNANQTTPLQPMMLPRDIEPPYVIETYPRNGARRIPINEFIDLIIRFSERMDGGSVKRAVNIDPPAAFEAFFDRESQLSDMDALHIRLFNTPDMPLNFETRYRVVIDTRAKTPTGVPMAEPFAFLFTTDGALIVNSIPQRNDSQFTLNLTQQLVIETNAAVDQKVFERSIRFRPMPDSKPEYQFIPIGAGTRILINANLRPNTRYRIQITNSLRTLDGHKFTNTPYTLNFSTVDAPDFDDQQSSRRSSRRRR